MSNGDFVYANCLLKHHIRTNAWLPLCAKRLSELRKDAGEAKPRRLRYFTFCATDAVDVLLLDVAKLLRRNGDGKFDTVFFFNRSDESVIETRKSIPGANGFPGDFVRVVVLDQMERGIVTRMTTEDEDSITADLSDSRLNRDRINRARTHLDFKAAFPFDVVNFDLEGYLFRATDEIPGDLIRAFQQVFEWQKQALLLDGTVSQVNAFTLMFTTRVGPQNMATGFRAMLKQIFDSNLSRDPILLEILEARPDVDRSTVLNQADFEAFFKLAAPKVLLETVLDADWYVDAEEGIRIYEIERRPDGVAPYRILHLTMEIRRALPTKENRQPGTTPDPVADHKQKVIRRLFEEVPAIVTDESIDQVGLAKNLSFIQGRREKYLAGK